MGAIKSAIATHWPTLASGVVVLFTVVLVNFPGRINADTVAMMTEMARGEITNWHAALLQLIWQPFFSIGAGVGFVFVAQTVVLLASIYTIVRTVIARQLAAAIITVAICLYPTTYGLITTVTRDTWFLAFWLAAFAVTCIRGLDDRWKLLFIGTCVLLAYGARQNGIAVAPAAFYATVRRWPWRPREPIRAVPRLAVSILLTGVVYAFLALILTIAGVRDVHNEAATPLLDLARLSLRKNELLIPPDANQSRLDLKDIAARVTPYVADELIYKGDKRIAIWLSAEQATAVFDAWIAAILDDPLQYLQMRGKLFGRQIGWTGNTRDAFLPAQIDNPFGVAPAFPSLSAIATGYLETFDAGAKWNESGVAYSSWPWLVALLIAMVQARFRGRLQAIIVPLGVSALCYVATVYVMAPQLSARFISPATIAAMLCATTLFARHTANHCGSSSAVA